MELMDLSKKAAMDINKADIKILIADDERGALELIDYILRDAGFTTESASDGKEAVDKIVRCRPDIIILDITMPRMNGIEVYQQLRDNPDTKNIPVIFLSGEIGLAGTVRNMNAPRRLLEYIEKPFNIEELFQKINNLIGYFETTATTS